jgi:hypothetical protein
MKRFGIICASFMLALVTAPFANANHNTTEVEVEGTEATWVWYIQNGSTVSDGIQEFEIFDADGNEILGDGYDTFGEITVDGVADDSATRTFDKNFVEWVINLNAESDIEIFGDLGCDSDCIYLIIGDRFFSYEDNGDLQPGSDPIFMWDTDGTIAYNDGDDEPTVSKTGTSLTFKHHGYAFLNDNSVSAGEFLDLFAQWVNEDVDRTDIFTIAWTPRSNFVSLSASVTSPVSLTANGSTLTCSAGTYHVGDSKVDISSFSYKLYVNGEDVSSKYPALISASGAKFDLSSISDYTARCEVTAVGFNSSITTSSSSITDSAYKARTAAAMAAKEASEELARSAATQANFTKEARDMRKRIAARQP